MLETVAPRMRLQNPEALFLHGRVPVEGFHRAAQPMRKMPGQMAGPAADIENGRDRRSGFSQKAQERFDFMLFLWGQSVGNRRAQCLQLRMSRKGAESLD